MSGQTSFPRLLSAVSLGLLLAGCAVGPDYVRPDVPTPAAYKELEGWKTAQPRDEVARGEWWRLYGDPVLDDLEAQVASANQNLAQAQAQYRAARALVESARASYFPTLDANASSVRSNRSGPVRNTHTLTLDAAWEADLWGKLRRTVESSRASADASAADAEAAKLSAQAELAVNYFQLRALDAQRQLLDDTVAAYEKSLQLTRNRYASGVVAKVDVVQAEAQLRTTQAQAVDTEEQRAQLEHAIALLVGKSPAQLSLPRVPLKAEAPFVPVGLPSQLLERRPDVAAAERRVAAANAQIGVAKAAYFPDLTLSASGGYVSSSFAQWLTVPNRVWSIGPALAATLFDAGRRRALTDQAVANYDAEAAAYRQTVLNAFREVEDYLAALRVLEREAAVQAQALQAARQSVQLTTNQYQAGIVNYLSVVTVQASALASERTAVDLLSRRLVASVLLVKALGGGWSQESAAQGGAAAPVALQR
jgi:NodT family efflux transporter outer membrane factor (OMF) lipoprotein